MGELRHDKWVGTTYGSKWMHRWLIGILKVTDVRLLYAFAFVFVVPPAMVAHGRERKSIYRYFRQRIGCGRIRAAWNTYVNHCKFSQVVIDRFAMYAGKKFDISIDGYDKFRELADLPGGFIQLSSHIGNYEIAGYSLVAKTKRLNALVFGGEKESVMANRSRMLDVNNIRMIPTKDDLSHLFVIDRAIADGEILSVPADRVFGSQKCFEIEFLGGKARFPQGPFILAATRNVPMLFVSVMKVSSKSYQIDVLEVKAESGGGTRKKAESLALRYVSLLEKTVRKYPAQWYNYFDFWA